MPSPFLRRAAACAAALVLSAACACGQDPESRRIDTVPRLDLRPPAETERSDRGGPPDVAAPHEGAEHDRHLQRDFDQKERRDRLKPDDDGSRDYLALGVVVVGSALVLLLVVVWGSRRRNG